VQVQDNESDIQTTAYKNSCKSQYHVSAFIPSCEIASDTAIRKAGAGSLWWRRALPWQRSRDWRQVLDDAMTRWALRHWLTVSSPPGEWRIDHSPADGRN